MIFTWLYLMIAQLELWISAWLIIHLTPVANIVPVWFATGAVVISGLLSSIDFIMPLDQTVIPALAVVFAFDSSILAYFVFMWGIKKIPGVN